MSARAQPAHGLDRPRLNYTGLFEASPNPQGLRMKSFVGA